MDNDPVNPSHNSDEEYQFTDDEGARKYESPSAASSSSVVENGDKDAASRKKLILIIIGVIVGVFCLYKLYGLFTVAPSTSKTMIAAPTTQTQVKAAAIPPVAVAVTPPQPVISEAKFNHEDITNKISTLEQTVIENGRKQENLQSQIGGISSAITDIQNNMAMLTQQMNAIAQQKSDSEAKLKAEQAKADAERKAEEAKKATKKYAYHQKEKTTVYATYYVRAMITGRAWLVSSKGATLTISTGDQLPGYGQIQEIDPEKGMVMTSSGRVINYMSRDR